MSILYSAVACDRIVLSEFASCDGNFKEISDQILKKLPNDTNKMTYYHGRYLFNMIQEKSYMFLCITDKTCQRTRAFLFLKEIQRQTLTLSTTKVMYIERILAEEMQRYSLEYNNIIIRDGEINEVNGIGVESSETILGEKILYVTNPDNLSYITTTENIEKPQTISGHSKHRKNIVIAIFIAILICLVLLLLASLSPYYVVILFLGIQYIKSKLVYLAAFILPNIFFIRSKKSSLDHCNNEFWDTVENTRYEPTHLQAKIII